MYKMRACLSCLYVIAIKRGGVGAKVWVAGHRERERENKKNKTKKGGEKEQECERGPLI